MLRRTVALTAFVVISAAGAAAPAAAQDRGAVELGAFGRYTRFAAGGVALANHAGVGGRAGLFLSPLLSVELDASRTLTHNRFANAGFVTYYPFHLRGMVNLPFTERLSILVGAGPMINRYGRSGGENDLGLGGLAGVRLRLASLVALRLDATADYAIHRSAGGSRYWNLGLQAGLSVLLGMPAGVSGTADTDGDGVMNARDRCPGTPPATAVDANGCTRRADSDNDGVIDINDICPGTPAGTKVDVNGCTGTEPKDSTAAPASSPASSAAAASDTDGDGVPNVSDRCPSSRPGEAVDAVGCRAIFGTGQTILTAPELLFDRGSVALGDRARQRLHQVAEALAAHPEISVEVAGYSDDADAALGRERAEAVKVYLTGQGAPGDRITAQGYPSPGGATAGRLEIRQK
jgi:outer membrane protein OmpA-like peptidoglycan-associated protein